MPSEPALRPLLIQEQQQQQQPTTTTTITTAPYLLLDSFTHYPAHASPPLTPKPSPRATPYPNPQSRRSSYIPTTINSHQSSSAPYEVRCVLPAKASPPIHPSSSTPSNQELVSLVHLQAQQVALQKQLRHVAAQQRMIALQLSTLLSMNQERANTFVEHDIREANATNRMADEDILAGLMFEM
ncbi:hypothetical protein BJ741DRAFT_589219 [Chytriomyces cf. hyalinus JEL632]|nr:hypothetical protein BJ741DRAFT_589219 [Chytriomyces cf. hyalinus JEL632]